MRKIFYTLGAAVLAATPIIAVVSCGGKKKQETKQADPIKGNPADIKVEPTKQSTPWSTLSQAKPLETEVADSEWIKHGDSSAPLWWSEHKINGEEIVNADKIGQSPFEKPTAWGAHTTYAFKIETKTKVYVFSRSGSSLAFNATRPAFIRDKATGAETPFTSQTDLDEKISVTLPTVTPYGAWSMHPDVWMSDSKNWWLKRTINGEKVNEVSLNRTPYSSTKLVTNSKEYVFNYYDEHNQPSFIQYSAAKTGWIKDKATGVETPFTSQADLQAKIVVKPVVETPKVEEVKSTTQQPTQQAAQQPAPTLVTKGRTERSFDATSSAQADAMPNFKLPGHTEEYTVADDGLYIVKHDYDGVLWEGTNKNGHEVNDEIKMLPTYGGAYAFSNKPQILEMAKGDSIYFLLDNDDADGITADKFLNELVFVDTSARSGEAEAQFSGDAKTGRLDRWEGSQTNHMSESFDAAMVKLKATETPAEFASIAAYYGVKTEPVNGKFIDDPAYKNHANRGFIPMSSAPNYFGYERVGRNAFKITFNNPLDINLSHAFFRIYNQNTKGVFSQGLFSLGNSGEWDAYEHAINNPDEHPDYNFIGRKNQYINK